jgi:hypothetical protein
MHIIDEHTRVLPAPPADVWPLILCLGGAQDRLWPTVDWPPLRLEQPLQLGSQGAHGDVKHRVIRIEEGRCLELAFVVEGAPGYIGGTHRFELVPLANGTSFTHVLEADLRFVSFLLCKALIIPVHAAIIEELLDNAEGVTAGEVKAPFQRSWWVRKLVSHSFARSTRS